MNFHAFYQYYFTYIRLLRKELYIIKKDREIIKKNAEFLYRHVESNPSSNLSQRCCNFKLLENGISGYKPIASFI